MQKKFCLVEIQCPIDAMQALPNISDGRNADAYDFWRRKSFSIPRSVDSIEFSTSFDSLLPRRYAVCFDASRCNCGSADS